MADVGSRAGLVGYYTDHSLRRTCVTELYSHGVNEQLIKEHTGDAVHDYKVTSTEQV